MSALKTQLEFELKRFNVTQKSIEKLKPFIKLTSRGYTYIGPCRSGIGPFAYYMTPTGQIVHAWQLLGSPYSSYYTTTPYTYSTPTTTTYSPVFPPAYPFTTPYATNPQDELKYLQEEKRMLEQQLKDLEKRLDELSKKEWITEKEE